MLTRRERRDYALLRLALCLEALALTSLMTWAVWSYMAPRLAIAVAIPCGVLLIIMMLGSLGARNEGHEQQPACTCGQSSPGARNERSC